MYRTLLLLVCSLLLAVPSALARAGEAGDLEEQMRSQSELIQELTKELERVRRTQRASEDRVLAVEDRLMKSEAVPPVAAGETARYQLTEPSPRNRFFLSGYATAQLADPQRGARHFTSQFNPIVHFQLNKQLHFMSELEIGLTEEGGTTETEVEFEFAQIDYLMNDWLTLSAGKLFLPFNTFGPKLHPSWINKLPSSPPIYGGHGSSGLIPILSQVGVTASGGVSLWDDESRLTYSLVVANGPSFDLHGHGGASHDDSASNASDAGGADHDDGDTGHELDDDDGDAHHDDGDADHDPDHDDGDTDHDPDDGDTGHTDDADAHGDTAATDDSGINDVAFGGRVGLLPTPGLKFGMSFLTGRASGSEDRYNLTGLDARYSVRGFELRGEWARLARRSGFTIPDGSGYYVQLAYRNPEWRGQLGLRDVLGRFEPVIRWGEVLNAGAASRDQLALGLNYWLFESVPLKVAYELNDGADNDNRFVLQFAYGF